MKIFITGCAKTGTTLVRRLFNAYDLKVCNSKEISLSEFISSDYQVGKRTVNTVFSGASNKKAVATQLAEIKKNNIKIINVFRGRTATLASSNNYVKPSRYDRCMFDMCMFPEYIDCLVRYEELIKNPDAVQAYISEVLNLTPAHKWSSYPKFVDPSQESNLPNNYNLRPIQ